MQLTSTGRGAVDLPLLPAAGRYRGVARWLGAAALLCGSAFLAACPGTFQLADHSLASIDLRLHYDSRRGLCPGAEVPLSAEVLRTDGKLHRTRGAGGGEVPWQDLLVEVQGADVRQGRLHVDEDPVSTYREPVRLTVAARHQPSVAKSLQLTVAYSCLQVTSAHGERGREGGAGSSGDSGDDGEDASEDSSATNGENGRNGQNGASGQQGGPAGELTATVAMFLDPQTKRSLLQVSVSRDTRSSRYLLDALSGSLTLSAIGGSGGDGGAGGKGGAGGEGGVGEPSGQDGVGGNGGDGAVGGEGGVGGQIHVTVDPAARKYLARLKFDNRGGEGGVGGRAGSGGSGRTDGLDGADGPTGRQGAPGPPATVVFAPVPLWPDLR